MDRMESNLFPQHAIYIRYPPWDGAIPVQPKCRPDRQLVSSANHRRYGPSAWQTVGYPLVSTYTNLWKNTIFNGEHPLFLWSVGHFQ